MVVGIASGQLDNIGTGGRICNGSPRARRIPDWSRGDFGSEGELRRRTAKRRWKTGTGGEVESRAVMSLYHKIPGKQFSTRTRQNGRHKAATVWNWASSRLCRLPLIKTDLWKELCRRKKLSRRGLCRLRLRRMYEKRTLGVQVGSCLLCRAAGCWVVGCWAAGLLSVGLCGLGLGLKKGSLQFRFPGCAGPWCSSVLALLGPDRQSHPWSAVEAG